MSWNGTLNAPESVANPVMDQQGRGNGIHVYGGDTAIYVVKNHNRGGWPVLDIEAARRNGTMFDWEAKFQFQLKPEEMPEFCLVMMGKHPSASFRFHGPDRKKALEIENQGDAVYLKLIQEGCRRYGVRILPGSAYLVSGLALEQLHRIHPTLSPGEIATLLEGTLNRLKAAPDRS